MLDLHISIVHEGKPIKPRSNCARKKIGEIFIKSEFEEFEMKKLEPDIIIHEETEKGINSDIVIIKEERWNQFEKPEEYV